MSTMTLNDVLKQRNIWHTIAVLPPRKADEVRVKSAPTKADLRTKAARDAIYDLQERWRI